ncbi:MAG: NnrU family protein [Geminicoccaceae bacterium]
MNDIVVAALFFVGTHIGIAATPLRAELIERVGERLYRLLFSLVSVVALVWLIIAYGRAPTAPLSFGAPAAGLPALVMPIALLLLVTASPQPNPTAVGQAPDPDAPQPARGMLRVTRHPLMWGIALWAASHLLANPDTASVVFFGAFVVLALGGAVSSTSDGPGRTHRAGACSCNARRSCPSPPSSRVASASSGPRSAGRGWVRRSSSTRSLWPRIPGFSGCRPSASSRSAGR